MIDAEKLVDDLLAACEETDALADVQFRLFADHLPTLAWMANGDGHIYWYNRAWYEYTGKSFEEIRGLDSRALALDILHPDFITEVESTWAQSIASGEPFRTTFPLRGADGSYAPFATYANPIKDERGKVLRWIGVNSEISRQAEAEARYRSIVNSAVDPMVVINPFGIINTVNPATERAFGYHAGELIGQNVKILMPDSVAAGHDKSLSRFRKTGVTKVVNNVTQVDAKRKDGSIFPVEVGVTEWECAEGKFYTGMFKDITERCLYETKLEALNADLEEKVASRAAELDTIFRMSSDILGMASLEGYMLSTSPAAYQILGWTNEEIIAKPFLEFIHDEDKESTKNIFQKILSGQSVTGYENRCLHKNGGFRWLSWNGTPSGEGKMSFVARDVTDDKVRDEALLQSQKMEAIGQLTGGIAHDFNNLLAAISGNLELLEMRAPKTEDGRIAKYIRNARVAVDRSAQLVKRLLAFARKQPLAPVPVNVTSLITSLGGVLTSSLGPTIKFSTELEENIWPVLCDANQLESSMLNLIINARDALPDGGSITLKTDNISNYRKFDLPSGEWIRICIGDTGTGMSQEVKERAFDPFFTTKPAGEGTGLGLSMLYGFVSQSGGHVRIESEVGKGTKVAIFLPRSEIAPEETAQVTFVANDDPSTGKTVLVVEDEEAIRAIVEEVLTDSGFHCVMAEDGHKALSIIQSCQPIDLLLSDFGLPNGMNGKQLADFARKERPKLKVLFMTGYAAGLTLRTELIGDGMEMLTKPFDVTALIDNVTDMTSAQ